MVKITEKGETTQGLSVKESLYGVDSLAIMIPLDLIEITHPTLNSMTIHVNEETGEPDNQSYKKNSYKDVIDGIYEIHYRITNLNLGKSDRDDNPIIIKCLSIGVHSKIVGKKYFEGITDEEYYSIYSKLMSRNIFKCTYKDFEEAYAEDIDVKIDSIMEMGLFPKLTKYLEDLIPLTKRINAGVNRFNRKTNKGVQFNTRKGSTSRHPYLKMYSKGLELLSKSMEFYNDKLSPRDVSNIVRTEYTIRGAQMKRDYQINMVTVKDVLNTSQEEFRRIHQLIVLKLFKDANMSLKTNDKDKKGLLPMDETICYLIELALESGKTIDLIIHGLRKRFTDKNARSDMKLKVEKIYNENIKSVKRFKDAEKMEDAFMFFSGGSKDFFNQGFEDESNEQKD